MTPMPQVLVTPAEVRNTLKRRLQSAVDALIEQTPAQNALKLLSSPTDVDALIAFVNQPDTIAALDPGVDPLRAAKSRAATKMASLLAARGGPWGVEQVAQHLGISRAAVDKRRKNGALIGIVDGARAAKYPSWQFTATGTIPGLVEVLRSMAVTDPWMQIQFFMAEDPDLKTNPLDALTEGRQAEVIATAARYGRQGADA
jgi:hypothetical protein